VNRLFLPTPAPLPPTFLSCGQNSTPYAEVGENDRGISSLRRVPASRPCADKLPRGRRLRRAGAGSCRSPRPTAGGTLLLSAGAAPQLQGRVKARGDAGDYEGARTAAVARSPNRTTTPTPNRTTTPTPNRTTTPTTARRSPNGSPSYSMEPSDRCSRIAPFCSSARAAATLRLWFCRKRQASRGADTERISVRTVTTRSERRRIVAVRRLGI
jgi:hypothetical protein